MNTRNVLARSRRPTENDCRDALAAGLALSAVIDMAWPDSDGGEVATDAELIDNLPEISAGLAIYTEMHHRAMVALEKKAAR